MNWINLNVSVLDSEEFLGATPTERATWLCLLRYCVGQENAGVIEGASEWKDRKWQQVVRITGKEVSAKCDLWRFEGGDLLLMFYPVDKEEEVRRNRANGAKGGRPVKAKHEPKRNHPVNPNETTRFDSAETEREGKDKGKEREGELPPNPHRRPSLEEALAAARDVGIVAEVVRTWWEAREANDWMKGTQGGGNTPVGPNWRADLSTAAKQGWPQEIIAKSKQNPGPSRPNRCV